MTLGDALVLIVFILAFPLWAIGLAIADRIENSKSAALEKEHNTPSKTHTGKERE